MGIGQRVSNCSVNIHFSVLHVCTIQMRGFCVDPKDSWPSVFILCSDNHVYRISSDEAPSFLTGAHGFFNSLKFWAKNEKSIGLLCLSLNNIRNALLFCSL